GLSRGGGGRDAHNYSGDEPRDFFERLADGLETLSTDGARATRPRAHAHGESRNRGARGGVDVSMDDAGNYYRQTASLPFCAHVSWPRLSQLLQPSEDA